MIPICSIFVIMMRKHVIFLLVMCFALLVSPVPSPFNQSPLFRGMPLEDEIVDPVVLEKMEEFRLNITSDRSRSSLLSCLEDQTYSAINDFANCHLFCPMCNQGYGRCDSTGSMRICICDCDFFHGFPHIYSEVECPWVRKLCTRVAESAEQALKLTDCQKECEARGFIDAALCGAEMEDPPLLRSTCTCLCP